MSNRALIVGGVALVALFAAVAFWLMPEPSLPEQPTEPATPQTPVVVEQPVSPPKLITADAGEAHGPADAGSFEPSFELTPIRGEQPLTQAQLAPAVAEVRRIARQCYSDVEKRYPPPHTLTLTFDARSDGEHLTLTTPIVEKSSIQDPFYEACVTDAPLDVQLPLSSVGSAHVVLPFRYSPSGG